MAEVAGERGAGTSPLRTWWLARGCRADVLRTVRGSGRLLPGGVRRCHRACRGGRWSCVRGRAAGQGGWRERMRAGLAALLVFLDAEPELGRLVVVEALGAGAARAGAPRAGVRGADAPLSTRGGGGGSRPAAPGAAAAHRGGGGRARCFSVIHARLSEPRPQAAACELLGELMGMIVLPYLGHAGGAEGIGPTGSHTQNQNHPGRPRPAGGAGHADHLPHGARADDDRGGPRMRATGGSRPRPRASPTRGRSPSCSRGCSIWG